MQKQNSKNKEPQFGRSPAYYAWKRLKKNKLAISGLIYIILCIFISILGPAILPDPTENANEQILEIETRKPGFSVQMLKVRKNAPEAGNNIFNTILSGKKPDYISRPISGYRFVNDKIEIIPYSETAPVNAGNAPDSAFTESYSLADVVFPLSTEDPEIKYSSKTNKIQFTDYSGATKEAEISELKDKIEQENIEQKTFWLGTDRYGRDMLSRLLLGTRISLAVGIIAVFISLVIGVSLGAIAGFFRGWADQLIMWFINVVWSIPTLLLVIAISMALGRGFWQVFIAVGLTMWVEVARIVRGQILGVRELEYVQAGRALGFHNYRIITKHILPNITGPIMVISAANFASAILLEAGLSFLGVGVQPPAPSWGVMLNDHFGYIIMDAAYLALLPGLAIMFMVLAFNLLGNGLRDALDVRMK
jgi:peptide/nickel transport system permease protein